MKKYLNYIYILLFAILIIYPLLGSSTYISGHDTSFHIANIKAISLMLEESIFVPKVLPLILGDLGYGSGIFYPRIFHVSAAILYNLGQNIGIGLPSVLTFMNFMTFLLAGVFTNMFAKRIIKDDKACLLASLFYMSSSYFITNIYVRSALAESLMFIFVPLAFIGIYELFYGSKKQFYIYFVSSFVLMINSHLITTFYLFLLLLFLLYVYKDKTFKYLKEFIIASIFIILLSLPTIIPTFVHKFSGNYILFVDGVMGSNGWAMNDALWGYELFIFPNNSNSSSFVINYMALIMVFFTVRDYIKKSRENKLNKVYDNLYNEEYPLLKGMIVFMIASIIFTTKLFPWYFIPNFMTLIQFPWRLNIFVSFGISIVSVYSYIYYKDRFKNLFWIILFGMFLFVYADFNSSKVTTFNDNTNFSDGMGWQKEYLPANLLDRYDVLDGIENSITSNCEIEYNILDNDFPNFTFELIASNNMCEIQLPKIYYLTYKFVYDGNEMDYFESNDGLISFNYIGNGVYKLSYSDNTLTKCANIVFIITLLCAIILLICKKSYEKK